MWLVFSDVWNAVVEELRAVDVVSDEERDNLVFVHLDIDPTIEVLGFSCVRVGGLGGFAEARWGAGDRDSGLEDLEARQMGQDAR